MSKIKSFDDMAAFIIAENKILSDKILNVKNELTAHINNITDQFNNKIEAVTKENAELRSQLSEMDDRLARCERGNQLIIRGVPVVGDDDLVAIFNEISHTVNFDVGSCNGYNIYRLLNRNSSSKRVLRSNTSSAVRQTTISKMNQPSIVIVQFVAHWDKLTFMHKYFSFIKIGELNHSSLGIGLNSNGRIYIGEHLTKKNHIIFIKCAILKSSGKISQYFTRNGLVFVRISKSSNPVSISSSDALFNDISSSLLHIQT